MVNPVLVQSAYRFRNDDGTESTATWRQNLNTADTIDANNNIRLRIASEETANAVISTTPRIEYNLNNGGWVEITTNSLDPIYIIDSTHFINGASTTQRITSGTFSGGYMMDTANQAANIDLTASIREDEWSLYVSQAASGTVLFRVTNGGTTYNTYNVEPSLTVNSVQAGFNMYIGTKQVTAIYVGTKQASAVYVGTKSV